VLGTLSDLERVVQEQSIDEVILCNDGADEEYYISLMKKCAETRAMVLVATSDFSVIPRYIPVERYGTIPVFGMMNAPPYLGLIVLKRVSDLIVASLGAIILLPVFTTVALAIKLESPGPVLFRQKRIGRNGKPFTFYKFRSMYNGSDRDQAREEKLRRFIREGKSDHESTTKIVDEKKTTRIGKFIRKTSIDELPQLINVIKGDMSLIGPRPCLEYEWEHYSEWHRHRARITPGCTGMWQVTGRSEVDFRDMVILDLFYVYNFSFPLDMWLLIKTIPVMLFGIGGK
jgi:exopolysaccharide biosynthesis polyprenyl glycosylphosphotransferase